jgi:hypothetical protein
LSPSRSQFLFTLYLEYKTGFLKGKKSDRKKWKILQIFPERLQPAMSLEDMNKTFEQIGEKTIIMFLLFTLFVIPAQQESKID